MAVVFQATLKLNREGTHWYIELQDTQDKRVLECSSIQEFEEKITELGEDYGGHVDEVKWLKDENVPPFMLDELRVQMQEWQQEQESDV